MVSICSRYDWYIDYFGTSQQNTDIDNILAGLKTKTVDIHQSNEDDNDSLISISSLKDMQNNTMPKKTNKRKNKSDKNILTLDI